MKVCVQGLWHLGSVTVACLVSVGHAVVGLDPEALTVATLAQGTDFVNRKVWHKS